MIGSKQVQALAIGFMAASIGLLAAAPIVEASFLCGKGCQQRRQNAVSNQIATQNCWDASQGKFVQMKVYLGGGSKRGDRLVSKGKVALPPGTIQASQCAQPNQSQLQAAGSNNGAAPSGQNPYYPTYSSGNNYPGYNPGYSR